MEKKINILLVDDEDEILNSLGDLIENMGWKCFKAPTGEIALDSLKINDIDAVILDVNLPRMSGFEVLKEMKGLKPTVPVIILTGIGSEKERIDKALKLGACGYVSKALPVKQTISEIKKALGRK